MGGEKSMKSVTAVFLATFLSCSPVFAEKNEVLPEGGVRVFICEHPQTGRSFVSLRKEGHAPDLFEGFVKREFRPDYKMLDAKTKPGDIPYDGPVSDLKKVYIFAATMMTLGAAGVVVTAAIPVGAAAAGASGGTGLLGAGAVTVAAGTAGTVALKSHLAPGEENYIHEGTSSAVSSAPQNLSLQDVLRGIDAGGGVT